MYVSPALTVKNQWLALAQAGCNRDLLPLHALPCLERCMRSLGGRRIPCTPGTSSAEFYVLCLLFTVVAYVSQDTYVTRIFYLCTRLFFLPCMSFAIIAAEAAAGQACFVKVVVIKSNLSPKKKLKAAS
jgi:hypothetical protein